jgi:hypothetical protein
MSVAALLLRPCRHGRDARQADPHLPEWSRDPAVINDIADWIGRLP